MDTLPPEVMTFILDLLPFTVRRNLAMMNKTWYYASLHPILLRKELLVFNEQSPFNELPSLNNQECSLDYDIFKNALIKTQRTLLQLKLQNLTFDHNKYLTIFENCGHRITSLYLDNVSSLTDAYLDIITIHCKNLEVLKLSNINQFSIYKPCLPIPKLRCIAFNRINNMSDKDFNFIIQCAPNLEHLSFNECQILTWPRIIRRYYLNETHGRHLMTYNSDDIFTDVNIINYLKTAKSIKDLKLQNCYHILYKLPEHFKLNSLLVHLNLNIQDQHIDNEAFKLKLGEHTSLKKLEITYIPCCFLPAISKLCNLNFLSLTFTTHVKSNCIDKAACLQTFYDSLENMIYMKTLRITQCPSSVDIGAKLFTPKIPDQTLRSLKLLDSTIESTFRVINLGQSLIDLRIQNGQILQSSDFLILFKTLTNLRCLSIEHCVELTDAILLSSPISNIKGLNTLKLINTRLTHRSLREIKCLHLETLIITSLSLGSCIEMGCLLEFEESMKQLSYSSPVLTSLLLSVLINEVIVLPKNDGNLYNPLLEPDVYVTYFKNLKKFQLLKQNVSI